MIRETFKNIQDYSLKKYEENNRVKVHITKLDYDEDTKYDTVCGVWVNGELSETYELENVSNKEIDEFLENTNQLVQSKTLFTI